MLDTLFSGGAVDRAAHLRSRAAALLAEPAARVLPLWRGKPLVREGGGGARLVWLSPAEAAFAGAAEPAVLLGRAPGGPRFAQDVSHLAEQEGGEGPRFLDERTLDFGEGRVFRELRGLMTALPAEEAGDAATAKGVIEWHRSHPRCARCGAPTAAEEGGWRRGCGECAAKHFPRTDPVVIMLTLRGDRTLLGRQAAWPAGMYSLLAGFVEPGETLEEAARRETLEEAGVQVGRVRYLCSQPWPFPASLMIGVAGEALSEAIRRDDHELEDALWVSREEVAASLRGEGPIRAAREGAVARTILKAWVDGRVPGFD